VTKLIEDASGSVPVFTDQRSTPQFGVGVEDGVGLGDGAALHVIDDDALRGFGTPTAKSTALLSVSVQPLFIRDMAVVLLGAPVAPLPSKQLAVLP
jgi:hypothetical protein